MMEDLVKGEDVFFAATGVTDGELLKGVQYKEILLPYIQWLYVPNQVHYASLRVNIVYKKSSN
jgi:fructose-1,6-bisphosphatase/sedoheptulose 1,7-bisphosphatase-like protein